MIFPPTTEKITGRWRRLRNETHN